MYADSDIDSLSLKMGDIIYIKFKNDLDSEKNEENTAKEWSFIGCRSGLIAITSDPIKLDPPLTPEQQRLKLLLATLLLNIEGLKGFYDDADTIPELETYGIFYKIYDISQLIYIETKPYSDRLAEMKTPQKLTALELFNFTDEQNLIEVIPGSTSIGAIWGRPAAVDTLASTLKLDRTKSLHFLAEKDLTEEGVSTFVDGNSKLKGIGHPAVSVFQRTSTVLKEQQTFAIIDALAPDNLSNTKLKDTDTPPCAELFPKGSRLVSHPTSAKLATCTVELKDGKAIQVILASTVSFLEVMKKIASYMTPIENGPQFPHWVSRDIVAAYGLLGLSAPVAKYDRYTLARYFRPEEEITVNGIKIEIKSMEKPALRAYNAGTNFDIPYCNVESIAELETRQLEVQKALADWKPIDKSYWIDLKNRNLKDALLIVYRDDDNDNPQYHFYLWGALDSTKWSESELHLTSMKSDSKKTFTSRMISGIRFHSSPGVRFDMVEEIYYYCKVDKDNPILNKPEKNLVDAPPGNSSDCSNNPSEDEQMTKPADTPDVTPAVVVTSDWPTATPPHRTSHNTRPPVVIENDLYVIRRFSNANMLLSSKTSNPTPASGASTADGSGSGSSEDPFNTAVTELNTQLGKHGAKWEALEDNIRTTNVKIALIATEFTQYARTFMEDLDTSKNPNGGGPAIPKLSIGRFINQSISSYDELFGRLQMVFQEQQRSCLVMAHEVMEYSKEITNNIQPWVGDAICLSNPDRLNWLLFRQQDQLQKLIAAGPTNDQPVTTMALTLIIPMFGINKLLTVEEKKLTTALERHTLLKKIKENKEFKNTMALLYTEAGSMFDEATAAAAALRDFNSYWEGMADLLACCVRECAVHHEGQPTFLHKRRFERMVRIMAIFEAHTQDLSNVLGTHNKPERVS